MLNIRISKRYVYKNSPEEEYIGFIAEDVPELVATNDRKSLASMDIVAVLTKVVKEQDSEIEALQQSVEELSKQQSELMAQLSILIQKLEPQNLDVSKL